MERFGKFELLEKIGTGGMAEVFLARPAGAAFSKVVAVKRILPRLSEDESFRQMFVREGAIALRFRHHAIIAVHELSNVDHTYYMAMEYFPGVTLTELIACLRDKKGTLDVSEKVLIIKCIAEALQYIHGFKDHGTPTEIIHRDISPHNILIGFDGGIKLIDFGVAKITSTDTTQSKTIKGKIAYMSPEQVRGKPLTKQTDIFSLGIVFWEILTSRKLFTGKTITQVIKKIERCEVPSISALVQDVPLELIRICRKALSEHLNLRYATAGEVVADLDAFLKSAGTEDLQNKLSEKIRTLFPAHFHKHQEILRRYEVVDVQTAAAYTPIPPSRPAEPRKTTIITNAKPVTTPLAASRERKRKAKFRLTIRAAVVLILFSAGAVLTVTKFRSEPPSAPSAPVPVPQDLPPPASAPAPSPTRPPATPPPAHPVARLEPNPLPQAQTIPAEVLENTQEREGAPAQADNATSDRPPTLPPPPKARRPMKRQSSRKAAAPSTGSKQAVRKMKSLKPPRKPAASPATLKKFARMTVLSDPGAQVYVDGVLAGTEIVNDVKVPADKPVIVKVILKGVSRSKEFTFKPFSQNVIEMNAK